MEARSLEGAVDLIQRQDFIVTEIDPVALSFFSSRAFSIFERVKQKDVVILSRQLSTLFQAKVPIIRSLRTLLEESGNTVLRRALGDVLDDVAGGSALSQAMARQPHVFSDFYVSMVRAGEESGKLEDVFAYLADYLERNFALVSKARGALIYPAFVSAAFVGVIVLMLVVVIPKLTSIFQELTQEVPLYTRIIIGFSAFLQRWGIFVAIALGILAVVGWRYVQTKKGREVFDEFRLRTPIFGNLFRKLALTRMTDNLATLIRAGIPIIRALEVTADVVGNQIYRRIILEAAESVKAGNTISSSFEKFRDVPPLVTQMIRIGEESGKLDFILESASAFYQRDVNNMLENFVALIEPVFILLLGLGVGVLMVAVLVPLYNLSAVL